MINKNTRNFIILFVAVILVLFLSLHDNYEEVINSIKNINKWYLLLAIILTSLSTSIRGFMMYVLSKVYNTNASIIKSIKLSFETNFFNGITPFATGGQPYQLYRLRKSGYRLADATNIVLQLSVIYQIILVFMGTFAVTYNHFNDVLVNTTILNRLVGIGFVVNFLVIVLLITVSISKKFKRIVSISILKLLSFFKLIKNKEKIKLKIETHLDEFDNGIDLLLENKKKFFFCLLIQLTIILINYSIPTILFMGSGVNINLLYGIIAVSYITMIGSFIPLPGSTGGIEYGFFSFFSNFIAGSILNATMLIWRTVTYYLNIILGLIIINCGKRKEK